MHVIRSDADQRILAQAAQQHGVVARVQLLRAGVSSEVVDARLRSGLLQRVHRGVYRVGPLAVPRSQEMAAVLACGDGAVLSGRSAAVLWQLMPSREKASVEVMISGRRPVARPGVVVRHVRRLRTDEVAVLDGIPITTPARTLYDLASTALHRDLESAWSEARVLNVVERSHVLALLAHHAARPGAARLRALVEAEGSARVTRSEAEERFLGLIRKAQLADPATNTEFAGYQVDFLWRRERLVVEVDGRAFHSAQRRFESDRRRDGVLVAAGVRVMRVTWSQIVNEPEALVARVAQALVRQVQP